jgi:hypothetical protein
MIYSCMQRNNLNIDQISKQQATRFYAPSYVYARSLYQQHISVLDINFNKGYKIENDIFSHCV